MSLQREYTMTINKETSVLNKNLTISTNDQGIDIIFRLIDCPYIKLSLKQNLYARIILLDPLGKQIDSDITSIVENRVIFKLTKNLMANIKCTGVYKLYIAIMDDKTNVNLLPPIKCTIEESEIEVRGLSVGLVNQSAIDNSLNTDYGNEIALFNADGSYNRTVWISGDMITTARMNKLEDAASNSRDEILNLKEQITQLNKKNMVKVMVGTEYEPIIISNLNKGFYIISGYVQDFPNKNPYLLSDENYFMVTFSDGNYSKIIRCLSGEEDFVKYKYDKTLEVIYKNEQELVVCKQAEGYVGVTLDEYQYIELNEDREVILPKPDSFTEIKLYVDAKQSDKLTFDGVIWNEPLDLVLGEMNTIYLSYINDKWYGSTNSDKDASDSSTPNQEATTHTCRETLFPSNGEVQLTSAPIQDLTLYSDCTIKIPSELSGKNVTLNVINTNDLTLRFSQDAKYHTFNLKAGTMSMFNINIDSEDSRIIRLHCIEDIIGDGDTIVEKYSITRHLSNSTINNTSNLIEKNGSYNATISAKNGYEIESIVVTMGGADITSTVVSGKRINIPNVTGDIVIMVTTTAVQITYTITNNLSHCTTNNNSNVISEGYSYRAIVTPNVGYQIERTTVTMGGTDISSTVVTGNNINIASVTGDIVITVIATASVSTPTTYTVTNNLSHCSTSNASNTIDKNESYNATISANSGYEIESIIVTMGGTDVSSTAVSGNNINILNVTGNIVITVQATAITVEPTTYSITRNLSNCTSSNTTSSVNQGASYSVIIIPDGRYELLNVTVTMGGTNVTSSVCTYENGNAVINIPNVTGDIVITVQATATAIPTTYSITRNLPNCTSSNTTSSVNQGASYSVIIIPDGRYELLNVTVTMGGTNVTSSVCTYENGNAVINIPNVTGNVVITVTTTAVQTTYSITNNLSNCTTNNSKSTINKNESYNATISPNSGYEIDGFNVTMGGTDITYQVVNGNNISIPNVTGDIVIIATATAVQKTYTIENNLSNCTTNNSKSTINENESYNATISPNSGYEIDGIVVYMGDTNVTSTVVSGKRINIPNVTGDIVIIATTTETTVVQTTYSITNNLSNCTTNNASEVINKNESYNATISPNSGYKIKSIVVTMGGTNVSSTVVNGNKINIPSVTGIVVITVTTNKIENGEELKDFPYADELVEIAMTYWRNANNEYVDGQPWSQGITYRASNTPLSAYCEASMSSQNSFWVSVGGRHYKAMDCSTLVGLCLRGYTYENGPYANETKFNAFRTNRNQTNPSVSWAFAVPREAASIGKYCYDNNWIVPLSTIGNSSNNYAGLKKGDIIFWAKKKSDGNYKEPDRFMKISHVAIVYGNSDTFNGRLSIVECTTVTPRNHTWQDGTTLNCGVRIKDLVNSKPDEVVLVARIQL